MEWKRGPIIGRGSSATVSLAKMVSGEVFAVKSAELTCSSPLQKEQSLISQLCSPYIINYIGSEIKCEKNKIMYNLFMEYMPGGTLADQIKKQGGSLKESLIKLYAHHILKGLNYLHSNGIVHCDIKPQNILIGKDGIKIADLGCAKIVQEDKTISGTPIFMAPEVARGEEQGFGADIWSFGCTIIEMAIGRVPWANMNDPVSALYRIGYSDDVIEFPSWLSNNATDFLSKCLRRNVKDRWTAKGLLHHPFFDGMEDEKLVQNSPTSILDQGFWDPLEESDSDFSSQVSCENFVSSNSPIDRIKKLVFSSSDSELPNWTMDENWLTIRGSLEEKNTVITRESFVGIDPILSDVSEGTNSQENLEIEKDCEDLMGLELPLVLVVSEEELESSLIVEDLLVSHLVDGINVSGGFTDRISTVDSSEIVQHEIVSIIFHFERRATIKLLTLLEICLNDPNEHYFTHSIMIELQCFSTGTFIGITVVTYRTPHQSTFGKSIVVYNRLFESRLYSVW